MCYGHGDFLLKGTKATVDRPHVILCCLQNAVIQDAMTKCQDSSNHPFKHPFLLIQGEMNDTAIGTSNVSPKTVRTWQANEGMGAQK